MVGAVGFEPTTPWSQTRCATKLRHAPNWGEWWGSNPRQPESQSGALPTELHPPLQHFQILKYQATINGAPDRIRTCDHPLRRRMLYPTELQAHDLWYQIPWNLRLEELVGAVGFEPTTPWSQTRCATKLRHAPIHLSFILHFMRYGVHSRRDA